MFLSQCSLFLSVADDEIIISLRSLSLQEIAWEKTMGKCICGSNTTKGIILKLALPIYIFLNVRM